jgi:ATP adenylyltransferase
MKTSLSKDIWPHERDIFARPHRLQYVRRLIEPKGCVFCSAEKNWRDPSSLVLYRDPQSLVILNKYPYNSGHLLILPRRHQADFTRLTQKQITGMNLLLKESLKILKRVYKADGFNTGMNLGKVAGAGLPEHLHLHVIPRWGGDTNFFPLIAETKLVVETNEQSYNQLRPLFAKLEKKGVL